MNVTIDISPLSIHQHKVRGVGSYVRNLQNSLKDLNSNDHFVFIHSLSKTPSTTNVLHIPYFDPFFLHLPITKKYPTIVTIHDLIPLVFPKHFPRGIRGEVKWQIQKYLVKKSDMIITDSEASKKDIIKTLNIQNDLVKVVYLAADKIFKTIELSEEIKNTLLKKYSLPGSFILYVGDVTWNKNLPRLAKAVKELDIELVTVGKAITQKNSHAENVWNLDLKEFQRYASETHTIHNLGYVGDEDLVKLYNLAKALVLPSLYEGFGLPVLEAMQCGTPVITSKNGSLPEVGGNACFYIDAKSVDSIAQGISTVCTSSSLQRELRMKGLIQANKFSWKKTAEATVKVYNDVFEGSR